MSDQVLQSAKDRMQKAVNQLQSDLSTLRAGRATPSLLDKVFVDYYGAMTPVNQLANISTPEPRLLTIQPYDKNSLADIEKAIQKSELGLTPNNDGNLIRIAIPALTQERRQELVKMIKKYGEEAKVAIRNVGRDAIESIKKSEKDGEMSEDDARREQDNIQEVTNGFISKVDQVVAEKEKEVTEV
jgi:ribosome recycling factor